ncbi:uncharacterized protein EAE98_010560 [Botrytis deweyae]|uniref:Major facilitator superfamily (MFS) profile domain-containing protein n=1 Tax=Botrytis deweyae TaxID=2478750 RepID=A0ABQ7I8K1_9HELO|nr:uncharacterized protein EAE98_010560 [Botrytis deweyae]KAF7916838.1 hypothetical protein EAE98_010560 [Botrytis deweyae]
MRSAGKFKFSVTIPKISTEFKALDDVGWYGSGYLITLTAFQPLQGAPTSYSILRLCTCYQLLYSKDPVGSIVCAASPSSPVFIIGRIFAGIGAAGILQGALGIITYISQLEKSALNMSIAISVFGISMCIAPVMGGALTDRTSWRWCFWINVPLGALLLALVAVFLKIKSIEKTARNLPLAIKLKRMDPIGIIIVIASVCCLFLALQFGGVSSPWKSSRVIGLFTGFGLLLIAFGILQWKLGENATIPLRFLKQRTVYMGSAFLFCTKMVNYIEMYYLPFYFQSARGSSPVRSAVDYIPLALAELFGIMLSGAMINKFGHHIPFILIGQTICAIGTGLLTTLNITTSTIDWATFLVICGFGIGVATFFSQLGGSIAVSIGNSFLVNGLAKEVPRQTSAISPQAVIDAGPLAVQNISADSTIVNAVQESYANSISHVFIFATAIVCFSMPMAAGMEWLNLNTISQGRKHGERKHENSKNEH